VSLQPVRRLSSYDRTASSAAYSRLPVRLDLAPLGDVRDQEHENYLP